MPRVSAFSPSRLQTYQSCPRRYYYQYVIKVPRRRQAAQSVGISLHGALEEVQAAGGLEATGIEGAIALLAERWEGEGFASPEEEAAARKQAEAMLGAYLARYGKGEGEPVLVESKLEASIQEVPFLGIVDRVDRLPDGSYELIDYKSGRLAVTDAVKQQLAIYRRLVEARLGQLPGRVAIHHLASNERVPVELGEGEWGELVERAVDGAHAIQQEQDYDPCVGRHCGWCDYNHRCLAFKRARHGRAPLP